MAHSGVVVANDSCGFVCRGDGDMLILFVRIGLGVFDVWGVAFWWVRWSLVRF